MFPPPSVLADSYKASHHRLYPDCVEMSAYGEFRRSFEKDSEDHRILFYGIRYIVETYIAPKWTLEDIDKAELFFSTHNAGYTPYPFPKDLFLKFVRERDGQFPVRVEAPLEGSVIYPHVPAYQITADDEYAPLCTFLETVLTMLWYPTTVATLSRRSKSLIQSAFDKSVEKSAHWLMDSRLVDFGFRGCTSVEQSIIGGAAHLVNFTASDTMSASYYVQFHLNGGKPVGSSIPATEHSVMTSWPTERQAIVNMIEEYGDGVFACVMDSYDYASALSKLLPSVRTLKLGKGGMMILRPDSGDPVQTVMMALEAGEKVFGVDMNTREYKVLRGCGVIQGDGVSPVTIAKILDTALGAGYSAQNISFGMGGGLLQKVNRDTMSFATKLSFWKGRDGKTHDIMKKPQTDSSKTSLPGQFVVCADDQGVPVVYPREEAPDKPNLLHVVYDNGKVFPWESFDTIRERADTEWKQHPKTADVISPQLKKKIERVKASLLERTDKMLAELR